MFKKYMIGLIFTTIGLYAAVNINNYSLVSGRNPQVQN